MKYLLIAVAGLALAGCISPTVTRTTAFDISTGKKLKEVVIEKYQPHATKSIGFGLRIGIDIETKTPVIWFGIIKREMIVADEDHNISIFDNYDNINLFLGSGSSNSRMEIINK